MPKLPARLDDKSADLDYREVPVPWAPLHAAPACESDQSSDQADSSSDAREGEDESEDDDEPAAVEPPTSTQSGCEPVCVEAPPESGWKPVPGGQPAQDEDQRAEDEEEPDERPLTLKAKAMSREHLLFHKPYNPYCDGCNAAKMRDIHHFKGAFDRKQTFWGELLTCDHIDSRSDVGLHGDKQALIIKDLFSKLRPVHSAKNQGSNGH